MINISHDYASINSALSNPANRNKVILVRDGVTYRNTSGHALYYSPAVNEIIIAFSPSEKFVLQPTDIIAVED